MSDTQINVKGVAFYGVIIAAVVLLALYFYGGTGSNFASPVTAFFNSVGASVSGWLGNIHLEGFDLGKLVSENFTSIIGLGVGAVSALVGYLKIRSLTSQINDELKPTIAGLSTTKASLESTVTGQAQQITSQAEELQMYAKDTTAEQLQLRIGELQTTYEARIKQLESDLEKANDKLSSIPYRTVKEVL